MCIIDELKQTAATVKYRGYYYKLSHVIEILILGLLCRLQTLKDIHFWATSKHVEPMLREKFGIRKIPCYSHLTNLVGMIDSDELNRLFMEFFCKLIKSARGKTVAIDGKTICTTANMGNFKSPLHIASAYVVENGITIGQLAAGGKGKEIPCVRELIRLLDISGSTVVTDALHCQKKTAKEILAAGADYVFSVKKNQKQLYNDVAEMVDFKLTDKYELLNAPLAKVTKTEKGHGRIEKRTAFVTHEVEWLVQFGKWHGVQSLGAIMTNTETRYYISSRKLLPMELLQITRNEWAVESMHWQLDVIFNEDRTTLHEENAQKTLNILRKTVLNVVRVYRDRSEPKLNMVDIMRKCLFDPDILIDVLSKFDICFQTVTN